MAKKNKPTKKVRKRVAEQKGMQQQIDLTLLPEDAGAILQLMNIGSFQMQGKMSEQFSVLKAKLATFAQGGPEPKPKPALVPDPDPDKEASK